MVALYTIGSRHSGETAIAAAGAVVAVGFVYRLAGGPGFSSADLIGLALIVRGRRPASASTSATAARGWTACASAPSCWTASASCSPQRAVAEERVRIAQELHDVVAHNVSLIVVQAQALGATAGDERVREATDGIADLGRETMAEMHRTLKLLRGGAAATRRSRRSRGWASSTTCSSARAARASASTSPSRASRGRCRRASTCRPTGSCRRRSPTSSSTPAARTPR